MAATAGHHCHAHGCKTPVPPKMFMCREHWFALPVPFRDAVWREHRPGQERDKSPSCRYLAVTFHCIMRVAFKPHDEAAAKICARYLSLSEEMRAQAIADGAGDPLEGLVS